MAVVPADVFNWQFFSFETAWVLAHELDPLLLGDLVFTDIKWFCNDDLVRREFVAVAGVFVGAH